MGGRADTSISGKENEPSMHAEETSSAPAAIVTRKGRENLPAKDDVFCMLLTVHAYMRPAARLKEIFGREKPSGDRS